MSTVLILHLRFKKAQTKIIWCKMSSRFAAIPCLAKILIFINHFCLCAAMVSNSQPQSMWFRLFLSLLKLLSELRDLR